MTTSTPKTLWYSIDRNLSAVDRGEATKEQALAIVEEYFSNLKPKYDSGEEAISATMFGFQKSPREFIEICINGATAISFRYEVSLPRRVLFLNLPRLMQKEVTLRSKDEVMNIVRRFYESDSSSFAAGLDG